MTPVRALPVVATRRQETAADAPFRARLFAGTRGPRFAGLDPDVADVLLRQQCMAQDGAYRTAFPDARFDIVECGGEPVGRIVTDRREDGFTLVDIALLPERRGRGLGTELIAELLDEACAANRPVRLSVAADNEDARRFYRRLGFRFVAHPSVARVGMEWTPPRLDARALPDALRLRLAFDPAPMAADCAALARSEWIAHFVQSNYDGDWSAIPLRAKAGATHPVATLASDPAADDHADTPILDACPAIRAALTAFRAPLASVRLMRLGPTSRIREHRDRDLSFEDGMVRLHVPLLTHPDVVFMLNGRRIAMEAGSVWYLRLSDPHAVENPGPGERVHLVIDAKVGAEIATLFAEALADERASEPAR